MKKAGTSSGVDALLFALPAPKMVAEIGHVFQGTMSRDGTLEKAGISSGVDALLFALPAPKMVAEIH